MRGVEAHRRATRFASPVSYRNGRSRALLAGQCRQHCRVARGGGKRSVRMILLDANLLIYARVRPSPKHTSARSWLDAQLSGTRPVGIPWPSALAFLRVVTNPRIFERPEPLAPLGSRSSCGFGGCGVDSATDRTPSRGAGGSLTPSPRQSCAGRSPRGVGHRARIDAVLDRRGLCQIQRRSLGEPAARTMILDKPA